MNDKWGLLEPLPPPWPILCLVWTLTMASSLTHWPSFYDPLARLLEVPRRRPVIGLFVCESLHPTFDTLATTSASEDACLFAWTTSSSSHGPVSHRINFMRSSRVPPRYPLPAIVYSVRQSAYTLGMDQHRYGPTMGVYCTSLSQLLSAGGFPWALCQLMWAH